MNYALLFLIALNVTPEDGSLLFIENGNRIVQNHTDSTITHVAIIFKNDDDFWVYEAVQPKVRKIKLADYYLEIEKINTRKKEKRKLKVWISNPNDPLTEIQKELAHIYGVLSSIRTNTALLNDALMLCELYDEEIEKTDPTFLTFDNSFYHFRKRFAKGLVSLLPKCIRLS